MATVKSTMTDQGATMPQFSEASQTDLLPKVIHNTVSLSEDIRTASKAYHHRGSNKSSVEDTFTAYLQNEAALEATLREVD